jgi:hypothetical protein
VPAEIATASIVVAAIVLVAIFGFLPDERPSRPGIPDTERALRWLYERFLLACILAAMVPAIFILLPYFLITELN